MPTRRRAEKKEESEYSNPVNVIVSLIAIAGIIAGLYYLYQKTRPQDQYQTTIEQQGPRLDAPDTRPNDPISVSDKPPGQK